jgi:hypothetical protein
MSDPHSDPWRTPTLISLGEDFQRLEQQERMPAPRPPARSGRGWRTASAFALVAVLVAVLAVALTGHPSRALADVRDAAAAAERAKTFVFHSTSVLSVAGAKPEVTSETGAIDLATPGYRVRVAAPGSGTGFERIVFPHALYVQPFEAEKRYPWAGVRLRPTAVIAPTMQGGRSVDDPLGLLAVLSQSRGAVRVGSQRIDGVETTHYRLRSTLGAFLRAQEQASPVIIDVWLDGADQVLLASREFLLGGPRRVQLQIRTSFTGYGAPVTLSAPRGVSLEVTESLNSAAKDVVGANVLDAVRNQSRHPATPDVHPPKPNRRPAGAGGGSSPQTHRPTPGSPSP